MNGVLLIVIDGLRPDALEVAPTRHLKRLMAEGAYTPAARTVSPSVTLPAHFSIFTSLEPVNHGVITNTTRPAPEVWLASLPVFLRFAGLRSAMFYNWEHIRELTPPGILDQAAFVDDAGEDGDGLVAEAAAEALGRRPPDFGFIYFTRLDGVGHKHGWMSDQYLAELDRVDGSVGRVLAAMDRVGPEKRYNVIVHSDHGGFEHGHEADRPECKTVPWLAWGPDIRSGADPGPVSVLDTAPTVARLLGLGQHPLWQGRPVEAVVGPGLEGSR
jgi:predicted AlkP superfamily pyrophosphatase or phosphodiesterase